MKENIVIELDLSGQTINELSGNISRLTALQTLNISHAKIRKLPAELTALRQLKTIKTTRLSTKVKREAQDILYLIGEFNRLDIDKKDGVELYRLLYSKKAQPKQDTLLAATNINHSLLRNRVETKLSELFKKRNKKQAIDQQCGFVFFGYFPSSFVYKNMLEKHGYISTEIYQKTSSHAIIGEGISPYDRKVIHENNLICMTGKDLQNFVEKLEIPYLKAEAAQYTGGLDNLRNMLKSNDERNVELALNILLGGGVPAILMTEVFLTSIFHHNSLYQSKAKRLLDIHAANRLQTFLSKYPYRDDFTAVQLSAWLLKAEKTDLDSGKIVKQLFEFDKKAAYHIFTKGHIALRHEILSRAHESGRLDLSQGSLKEIPKEIFKYENWKALNFSYNRLSDVPVLYKLATLKQLEILDIRFNRFDKEELEQLNLGHIRLLY